jgi:SNF2 family DNA or RNA helicase
LRVQHLYLRRTKEDIGNSLPTKTIHEVYYNLNSLQKMEYDKLWEEYETAQLEADPTKEINKELLEGAIYRRYCAIQMIPNTIKLAEKLISEGKKVIIATCYDDEINSLKEYFGERAVMYNGKMNIKQKDAAKEAFLTNPNITVFLGNIIAASVGLTLIVSNALLFNSFSYTDAENKQMEDRIYRIGQTKDVDIYYQMFRKTRCEDVWNICLRKEAIANAVIKKEDEK